MKTQLLASLIVASLSTAAFAAQPAVQNETAGVSSAAQVLVAQQDAEHNRASLIETRSSQDQVAEQDAEHNRASLIETRSSQDQVAEQDAEHNRASLIESGFDQGNLVAQQDAEHNRAS
jgi:hypothetical protein